MQNIHGVAPIAELDGDDVWQMWPSKGADLMGFREETVRLSIRSIRWMLLGSCLAGFIVSTSSCRPVPPVSVSSTQPANQQVVGIPTPVGEMMDNFISFQFGIYYLPKLIYDPCEKVDALLSDKFPDMQRVESIEEQPTRMCMSVRIESDVKGNYPLPDLESLQRFGHGLSPQQVEDLQKSDHVLILDFAHPKEHVWDGLLNALKLAHSVAQALDGLIWDDATREVFSPHEWKLRRIDGWDAGIPEISTHTVIHAYKKNGYVRAISLGMSKFGLPDIVIDQFSWSLQRNMGHIVNLFGQAIAEGATVTKVGEFDLDFRSIKNATVRESQMTTLKPNGTGIAQLSLRKGTWEEGDPYNPLIEITFERGNGPDIHAKQVDIVSRAFGSEDSIARIQHDDELEEASRKARERLPSLRVEFNKGFAPGEFLLVKAPFATPDDGHEWMWVEVNKWQGDGITGSLQNDPFDIPDLHAGQTVEVSESEVFDFLRVHADGTTEGNETSKVIEKQSQ